MKMKPVRGTFHAEARSERARASCKKCEEDITVMATLRESIVITARGLVAARKHLDEDW